MEALLADLRYAARSLLKSPGFATVAVLTLALGAGANTAIFTAVDAALLRDPPFAHPENLVVLWEQNPGLDKAREPVSAANFRDWKAESRAFSDMSLWVSWGHTLTGIGDPEEIETVRVSGSLFRLLGAAPLHGRVLLPDDETAGQDKVVVLSHAFWVQRMGADPGVIGRTLRLDDEPLTIVGVMPSRFRFPGSAKVAMWLPLTVQPSELVSRAERMFNVLARLSPGVSIDRAKDKMGALAGRLAASYPATNAGWSVEMAPLSELIEGSARRPLLVLFGAAGFVLLIACANVANLSLARAARRQRELGIRAALGAGQLRLTRLLLTESALLAFGGGLLGLLAALWGTRVLSQIGAAHLPGWAAIQMDGRVLAFATAVSILTALLCGIGPARRAARLAPREAMERGFSPRTLAGRWLQPRHILVVGEVAISFVLLVGAGLLLRSFSKLVQVDPGFRPEQLLAVTIFLPERKYPEGVRQSAFFDALLARVRRLPTVSSASAVTTLPLNPVGIDYDLPFSVEGQGPTAPGESPRLDFRLAGPDYFRTLGVPLIRGRDFRSDDRAGAPAVTIVSQTLASRFFGTTDPVGRRVRIGGGIGSSEIVGVVADVRHDGLDARPTPEMYVPYPQYPHSGMTLVLRVRGDPLLVVSPVKTEVLQLDPTLAISQIATLPEILANSVSGERFNAMLLGSLAALALALASLGIYGVLAYLVNLQTREIGLRLALGARPSQVLSRILRQGLGLTAAGVIAGVGGALIVTRVLAGLLYEVTPEDPPTFAGIAVLLFAVATLACAVPARRAARVDPMIALRSE